MRKYLFLLCVIVGGVFADDRVWTEEGASEREVDVRDSLPSFALNNFKDVLITWAKAKDALLKPPVRPFGLNNLRIATDWSTSALSADSTLLAIDDSVLGDPLQFDGDCDFSTKGVFETTFSTYLNQSLPGSIAVSVSYVLPPGEQFYIVEYSVSNADTIGHTIRVMNYVVTDNPSENAEPEWGWYDSSSNLFMVDLTKTGQYYFASGAFENDISEFQIGSADGSDSPISQFVKGALGNQTTYQGQTVSIGLSSFFSLKGGETKKFYFWKTLQTNFDECVAVAKIVRSRTVNDWIIQAGDSYAEWLGKALRPPSLTPEEKLLFDKSLLCLKNAQNPSIGTIVASFHPLYGYKGWARDGLFAALILHSSGFEDEAALFYDWISTAKLREDGELEDAKTAFHTTYSWWTGEPVSFVEPQYDSAGAFLLAMAHWTILSGSLPRTSWLQRIADLESFFLTQVGEFGLAPSDYSIWEESSDPLTGDPLPTSYFAFTQGMASAGLWAIAQVEKMRGQAELASSLESRSADIVSAVEDHLWNEEKGYYVRGIWSDSLKPDDRADAASTSLVFTGMTSVNRSARHVSRIVSTLTQRGVGISRYENDPFFYNSIYSPAGQEVGAPAPPWGVTTSFVTWCEMQEGLQKFGSVDSRIRWMVDVSAKGFMPVGEAVDGVSTSFVWASCPDLYEHGGVFVWSCLMRDGLTPLPNPHTWF